MNLGWSMHLTPRHGGAAASVSRWSRWDWGGNLLVVGQRMTGSPCPSWIAIIRFCLEDKIEICLQDTSRNVTVSIYILFYSEIPILKKKAAPQWETVLDVFALYFSTVYILVLMPFTYGSDLSALICILWICQLKKIGLSLVASCFFLVLFRKMQQ